jgi:OOP family OmpA-OmpF porin
MSLKKILGLTILSAFISLNAGMIASITGVNVQEKEYKGNERGIIVDQDVDGDGIIDSKDDCLETIPCVKEGCIKVKPKVKPVVIGDDDKDGVLNNIDECPNTPKGFQVDKVGCSTLVNLDVQFDTSKWNIKEEYTQKIEVFVNFMKNHPKYNAVIEGHTDSRDTEKKNQKLSENRATSVKKYMISMGIEEERLESVGYGELNPITTNKTKEGRATNRRVVADLKK